MSRSTVAVAAFAVAALVPLVVGDARTADLAGGLYLACAAVGLALVVGVAGLPSLAQGAFVAVGAVAGAHLLAHGAPTLVAAVGGGLAGGLAGAVTGAAFVRLPRAGFAAATWIVAWLMAFATQSIGWVLGGSQGIVVQGGPSPTDHYELALALTALAAAGYLVLARATFGLRLAAAREREAAARTLRVPVVRLRVLAMSASGVPAGVTGALGVQLAGVADPTLYSPYLSFKLLVVVLLGGALAPLGAPAGVLVLGALSVVADAITSLEHVAASRSHALLAAILLLGVVSLGWNGLVRPVRTRRRGAGAPPAETFAGALSANGLSKRYGELAAADEVSLDGRCRDGHRRDRPERLGQDDGPPSARGYDPARRGQDRRHGRRHPHAPGDVGLPAADGPRARARRIGRPPPPRRVHPNARCDASGETRGRGVRRGGRRVARTVRAHAGHRRTRASGLRPAPADAGGSGGDRRGCPARRRADCRPLSRRSQPVRRACCEPCATKAERSWSSSTTSRSSASSRIASSCSTPAG